MKLSLSCRKNLHTFLIDIDFKKIFNLDTIKVFSFIDITIVISRQPI